MARVRRVASKSASPDGALVVNGAREHNLKNITVAFPRGKLVVITGPSGSGKSSLAFDTIYAEGQRRYVESLSAYARQFLEQMEKPDVDSIEGLSPAIAIEQKSTSRNPRSTVGTVTEIYDYLRLLFARVGTAFCYKCGRVIRPQTIQQIVDQILDLPERSRIYVLAPLVRGRKGEYRKEFADLGRAGFVRVRVDGELRDLSDEIVLDRKRKHDIEVLVDRLVIRDGIATRLADSLAVAFEHGEDVVQIAVLDENGEIEREMLFSQRFACTDCGVSFPELTPRMFSFNNPQGACGECSGLGTLNYFDPDLVVPDPSKSLAEGAIVPWSSKAAATYREQVLAGVAKHFNVSLTTPFGKLPAKARKGILFGTGDREIPFVYSKGRRRYEFTRKFEGVIGVLDRRYRETESEWSREDLGRYMSRSPCPQCAGARLRPEALSVRLGEKNIAEVSSLSVGEAGVFFDNLALGETQMEVGERILREIRERLGFLVSVGLDYVTLDRRAGSLSGGEAQRIRLATQIGSRLTGVLYVLDEPSIGLHQRDNERLLGTLRRLQGLGNTVVVVEHDRDTIVAADHVVDMGPGAGVAGGEVVAEGTAAAIAKKPKSLTGRYLSGALEISVPEERRSGNGWKLEIKGARHNNLKGIDVAIPLGTLTCVTGVSGSGKSSLVNDTLYRGLAQRLYDSKEQPGAHKAMVGWQLIDKVIDINQAPIGRTPRSNPATYAGLFTHVRELFAQLPEARARGYGPGRFSFNVKGGRCEACSGDGVNRIEMHFLPDVFVTCEVCKGNRYARETMEVRYRGKNIAEVLEMTVEEALHFLTNVPPARQKLETLSGVGLDYIRLGQAATTLSGGEAQRIKLAKELSKRATGKTMYILDEPTTGLHFDDVRRLLEVLDQLVDTGNTVVVIEHNVDVIKAADHIIDIGPEGGADGGRVIARGTPEEIAAVAESHTGRFLKPLLAS